MATGQTEQVAPVVAARGWRRMAGLLVGVLIVAFLAWFVARDWDSVRSYPWRLEPQWLVAGVLLSLASYVVSGAGYVAIAERLHRHCPDRRRLLSIWARSLLARYIPGNVMMVLGRVVLSYEAGVPRRVTLAATVYEQALGLGVGALGALAFVGAYSDLGHGGLLWLIALVPLGLVLLHPRPFGRLSAWVLARVRREPLGALLSARQVMAFLGWYALSAGALCLGVWAFVRSAVGPRAGDPAFVGLAFLLAFTVSMLLFIFPSGLGAREGVLALALGQRFPGAVAVALAAGLRVAVVAVELVFVGLAVLAGRGRR